MIMKKDFVEKDEFENGVRMMLNFGHTVGHAIEAESEYTILHGEGVAMGMEVVTKACVLNGICDEKVIEQVKKDVEVLTWIVHTIRYSIYVPHLPDYEPARQAGFSQIKKVVEEYYANGLHTIGI